MDELPDDDSLIPDTPANVLLEIMGGQVKTNKLGKQVTVVDPALRSEHSALTQILAKKQTKAARNMLAKPGPEVRKQMAGAAGKLSDSYDKLAPELQCALGARLFGDQGMMANVGNGQEAPAKLEAQRLALGETLKRLMADSAEVKPADRSVLMALMGDIGALFTDTGATTGTVRDTRTSDALREQMAKLIGRGQRLSRVLENFARVKHVGGSEAVAPNKNAERVNLPTTEEPLAPRTGIHNTGKALDDEAGIEAEDRLGASKWAKARIDERRVAATAEPFAGHMSGSPSEILQVWDMLVGVSPDEQFTHMEDTRRT